MADPAGANHSQFIEHITGTLQTVPALVNAKIIGRPRDIQNFENIQDAFTGGTPAVLNAWVISRAGAAIARHDAQGGIPRSHEFRVHTYVVRGYYGMSDDLATDDIFQEIINDIMDAFLQRRQKLTPTTTPFFEDTDAIVARNISVRQFAGFYCHYCEISLTLRERITHILYN